MKIEKIKDVNGDMTLSVIFEGMGYPDKIEIIGSKNGYDITCYFESE